LPIFNSAPTEQSGQNDITGEDSVECELILSVLAFQIHEIKFVNEIGHFEHLSPLGHLSAFSIDIDAKSPSHCLIHARKDPDQGRFADNPAIADEKRV
jgi:hypothetical protein